jgi:hypothetical protein
MDQFWCGGFEIFFLQDRDVVNAVKALLLNKFKE